ncbi:MAG: hypothetical protein JXJ04_09730 [Spirochaetales bacterium]|nr:hypothetical protein [Spirochaetales bacterium]
MFSKVLLMGCALLLFIIDVIRIIKKDPIRQEWFSFFYLIFFFIIIRQIIDPPSLLSLKNIPVFLAACGLTLVHISVTVLNYWIIYIRWERMIAFFIITWTGITSLFIFNLYLILNKVQ